MAKYTYYEKGKTIERFKGVEDGVVLEYSSFCGLVMVFTYNNPTPDEIMEFESNTSEFRFIEFEETIILTSKIGNLPWADAPFTPHLSKDFTNIISPESSDRGLSLLIMLVDASNGILINMRLLGLSNKFTVEFNKAVERLYTKPFDRKRYDNSIDRIFRTYNSKQLATMSKNYCRFR